MKVKVENGELRDRTEMKRRKGKDKKQKEQENGYKPRRRCPLHLSRPLRLLHTVPSFIWAGTSRLL